MTKLLLTQSPKCVCRLVSGLNSLQTEVCTKLLLLGVKRVGSLTILSHVLLIGHTLTIAILVGGLLGLLWAHAVGATPTLGRAVEVLGAGTAAVGLARVRALAGLAAKLGVRVHVPVDFTVGSAVYEGKAVADDDAEEEEEEEEEVEEIDVGGKGSAC